MLHRDQLGEDADRNLLRRDRADVEADRGVHLLQVLVGHGVGLQRLVDPRDLGAAADEPEVAQLARRQRTQRFEVVACGRA